MANNVHMSDVAANAEANALSVLANGGFLNIYDSTGTGQPANANTAITTQVRLAHLTLNATAFATAVAGVLTANSITSDTSTVAGTATWFRVFESNGTTALWDGSVGTSGSDLNLNSVTISGGATLAVSAFTHTVTE